MFYWLLVRVRVRVRVRLGLGLLEGTLQFDFVFYQVVFS